MIIYFFKRLMPEKHTANNIYERVSQICEDYGLSIEKIPIISDSASNMKSAFKNNFWLPCMCHRLHTAITCAWNEVLEDPEIKLVYQKMLDVRAFVHKSSNKGSQLTKRLPNDTPTRPWCGLSQFFIAFDASYDDLTRITEDSKVTMPTDRPLIREILKFFTIFDKPFESLQSTKNTSIYMVIIQIAAIFRKLNKLPDRLNVIKTAITKCIFYLYHKNVYVLT